MMWSLAVICTACTSVSIYKWGDLMSGEPTLEYKFQVGGTLPANASSYVRRKADDDLYNYLKDGEFCYVLNSRQMGKSSLLNRTMHQLQENGIAVCGWVDLQAIGGNNPTEEQWYYSIIHNLIKNLESSKLRDYLKSNLKIWWHEQKELSPVRKLGVWLDEILLESVTDKNIIIFIDEIDNIRHLKFTTDDFFSLIRSCCNHRAIQAQSNRLTFVLCGVAKPSDLIQDPIQSPFNIGKGIALTPLELANTKNLSEIFIKQAANPSNLVKEIFRWTNGQPFLTQQLGQLIAEDGTNIPEGQESSMVEQQVRKKIIKNWQYQDGAILQVHLDTIRKRLIADDWGKLKRLELCHKILKYGKLEVNDNPEEASVELDLRLTGLVIKQGQKLKIYNRIYQYIFDIKWMKKELKICRPYNEKLLAWLVSDKQDYSQLLYGDELKKLEKWREKQRLGDHDLKFLGSSDKFDSKAQGFFARTSNYETAIRRMLSWTHGKESLNESIFKIASNIFQSPKKRGDAEWIDNLVRWHLIENWETHEQAKPLRKTRDYLLKNRNCDPFWLLLSYQQILQGTSFNPSCPEHQELLKSGLVVDKDGELTVHNRIYEAVFDSNWVTKELNSLRPYAKELVAWLNSDCRDESTLLRGQVLQDSLTSIQGKSLSEKEEQFLIASQVVNLRVI
ncbi:MAG: hypothetical protein F6K41_12845 [Symploca sp. SIO3E6]|nr:hypothetical protein [Caldora sp. SIO3E6]